MDFFFWVTTGSASVWTSNIRLLLIGSSLKISLENPLSSSLDMLLDLAYSGHRPFSYTQAKFLYQNAENSAKEAYLRIYTQVPHRGTEGDPHTVRAGQAEIRTHNDVAALKLLGEKQARHIPISLRFKEERQDESSIIFVGQTSWRSSE